MRFLQKLAQFGIIISLPFFLIIAAIRVLTSPLYLNFEYNMPSFPIDNYGFSIEDRLAIATPSLKFVRDLLPIDYLAKQTYAGQPVYNDRELGHMVDVQAVFQGVWKGWSIATLVLLASVTGLWINQKTRIKLLRALEVSGGITVLAIFTIGFLAVIGWDTWFTTFHRIFFVEGSWLFSPADTLIRLFPIHFWFDSVILISVITLAGGFLVMLVGYKFRISKYRLGSITESGAGSP